MLKRKCSKELSRIAVENLPDIKECSEEKWIIHKKYEKYEKTLQDVFLETLCENKIPISVFLISGIKLQGYLDDFDQKVLVLKNSLIQTIAGQIIYKRAIATIVPIYPIELLETSTNEK